MVIAAELGRSRFANVGFGESAGQDYDWLLTSTRRQRWADELFLLRVTDDNNSSVYLRRLRLRSCDMGINERVYVCAFRIKSPSNRLRLLNITATTHVAFIVPPERIQI